MTVRQLMFVLFTLAIAAIVSPLHASQSGDVTSTDVYWHVQTVANDLEQIRIYTGRPEVEPSGFEVRGVAPREVIYQAATLFKKVNRLSYEMIREVEREPVVPEHDITPADVLKFVQVAHAQIQEIAEAFELEPAAPVTTESEPKTPTDVYQAILQLNRQINILLDQRFAPEDVYEKVTLAIAHAASLRGQWPGRRIPSEPDWKLGKRSSDVFFLLLECFELVRPIAENLDLVILEFSVNDTMANGVTPSDVYDLAVLIVSELSYLDRMLSDDPSKRKARYPGRKVPSDVFQRVEILRAQLQEVNDLIESRPPAEDVGS